MKYKTRRYFTQSDKAPMWDRWQKGVVELTILFSQMSPAVNSAGVDDSTTNPDLIRDAARQSQQNTVLGSAYLTSTL